MPDLSVVVLCYKAGRGVAPFTARLEAAIQPLTGDYELVLVGNFNAGDDSDPTPDAIRAEAARNPCIKTVIRPKEGMMGWDARTGLNAATGNVVILIDGDNQMPPEDVARVYRKLKDENLDLAMTYRIRRGDGIFREINSRIYNLIFGILFPGLAAKDVNSKPKALTRELLDKMELSSDGWFLDAEILILARRYHARFGQMPTDFFESEDRKSFVKPGAVLEFLRELAVWRFREFFARGKT